MIFIIALIALAAIVAFLHYSHNKKIAALDAKFMAGIQALAKDIEIFFDKGNT